ncbi:MAG: protein BatD [Candidatus Hydrogenedentes bacterium]|nr:protein BatD [Candidatus Hydrogenedentota bacterium]
MRGCLPVLLALSLSSYAATISISTESQTFTKGVPFIVEVVIGGREVTGIDLPECEGASIGRAPAYSSSAFQDVNGTITSTITLGYNVTPDRAGAIVIPPFKAVADGETVSSQDLRITVMDAPKPADSTARSTSGDRALFTEIKTDKLEAYQGEPIILTMEVWIGEGAAVRYEPTGFPELTGFYALPRDVASEGRALERHETRDGRNYKVVPFVQILFPAQSGELRIGPWTWSCSIAFGGRARSRDVKTNPFSINVKPLPPPPQGFSGSVGKYQITSSLSAPSTDVGVPSMLTVNVSGNGNPDAIGLPALPAIDGLYIDEPKRKDNAISAGPAGQDFVFKITPQRAGDIEIPAISYTYFDPELGSYQTAQTNPLVLLVRGAKKEEQVVVGAGGEFKKESLGSDILDIVPSTRTLAPEHNLTVPTMLGFGAPVVAYLAFGIALRRQRRFATDRAYARKYGALKRASELLEKARQSRKSADVLYHAVTGYVADEFDLPETGMTSAEARLFFSSQRVPDDIAEPFHKILKACERARYAASELSADEVDALIQGAKTGMERLDQFLRQGRAA